MNKPLSPLQRFWLLLKPDKKEISGVYAYAIFHGLVNLSIPLGIQAIVNLIQGGQVSSSWLILVLVVVLGVAFAGVLQLQQMRIIEDLQQNLFVRAAFEFTYRIARIKSWVLDRYDASELMNRFFDTLIVQKGLSKLLIDFSTASLQILFGLILLSLYHPFFIAFGLALILLIYAIFRLTSAKGLETSLKESKYKYKVVYWLENLAASKDAFKLAGNTDLHMRKTDQNVKGYVDSRESHFKVLRQQYMLLVVFKVLVAAGLLLIGGLLVLNQQMNIGQFIAAEIIILLVINSVEKLILSIENIYDVLAALEKIGEVTDMETESVGGTSFEHNYAIDSGIELEIKNIQFAYPGSNGPVIDGLSLHLKPGEKVCISGGNGSGKSTLLHLVSGLYRPKSGAICFNGLPADNYNPDSLRKRLGIRLPDDRLFFGSVEENISLGRDNVQLQDVLWAVKHAQLESYIQNLPDGLNTVIGAEGAKLSKSLVQKILLARAIANRPGLLLLENSIAFIEESEQKRIVDFLFDPSNAWTILASSMNAGMQNKADRVLQMESINFKH